MKRASDRQLTKDDSDRAALDVPSDQPGEFEKAAPDVLAKRRILKVRRSLPRQASPDESKPANPFAVLNAGNGETDPAKPQPEQVKEASKENAPAAVEEKKDAAPPVSPAPDAEAPTSDAKKEVKEGKKADEGPKESDAVPEKPADPPAAEEPANDDDEPPAAATETPDAPAPPKEAPKPDAAEKPEEPPAKPDATEKPEELASAKADAPPTAAAPTKPDEPPLAESAAKDNAAPDVEPAKSEAAAAAGAPGRTEAPPVAEPVKGVDAAAPTPAVKTNGATFKAPISFGVSASAPLTFANAAAADNGSFNIKPVGKTTAPATAATKEFKEAKVQTGEENERELFRARAKLYNLETGENGTARWKERGVGGLKLNLHLENEKARLLMRTEATLKVILNTPIFEGFRFDRATERSLRFQGYDPKDAKKPLTFLVRFTTNDVSNGLVEAVKKVQQDEGDK